MTLISTSWAQQQVNGIKQIFDISMDNIGNATVEVSMKLNASQWDMFKRNVGTNTTILKRSMEKSLPKFYLSNFSFSEDQNERIYKIKFNVLGLAAIDGKGNWKAQLDTKDPDVTKLSDREFMITADMMSEGALFQITQKIHLPSGAKGAKIEKDSFGKAVLTYKTGSGFMSQAGLYAGILLMAAGGFTFYRNSKSGSGKPSGAGKQNSGSSTSTAT